MTKSPLTVARLLFVALVTSGLAGCTNPRSQALPADLAHAESDTAFQAAVNKLPPEEKELLASYVRDRLKREVLVKAGLAPAPTERTIGEAIAAETKLVAAQKAGEEVLKARDKAYAGLPKSEQEFCKAVNQAQEEYRDAKAERQNQLKLAQVRADRKEDLEAMAPELAGAGAVAWLGTISRLKTKGDGEASVEITLPCEHPVKVKTFAGDNLIPQSSPMYRTLADLGTGKRIVFSGRFYTDPRDGLRELSVTEDGSMRAPEFLFKFATIGATP